MLPMGFALYQSVHGSHYFVVGPFNGLTNYAAILLSDQGVRDVVNSIVFVVGTLVLAMAFGVSLALVLNRKFPLRGFFRTILLAPWLVSALSAGLLWAWLLNAHFGPIAHLLSGFDVTMPNALTSPTFAMPALCLVNAWSAYPLVMVLTLAALQTIPKEVLEAARIDGAVGLRRFRHIVFPLIRNTALVLTVLTSIHAFNHVTLVFVMTGGGPVGSTEVMALRIFMEGFRFYHLGIASAGAVLMFLLNIAFTFAYVRVLRTERT
jgi:ABC-type sugar transport system permease subunit